MKKRVLKRVLAFSCCIVVLFSFFAVSAFADDINRDIPDNEGLHDTYKGHIMPENIFQGQGFYFNLGGASNPSDAICFVKNNCWCGFVPTQYNMQHVDTYLDYYVNELLQDMGILTYQFNRKFLDDGGYPYAYYDEYYGLYYDELELYISVYKEDDYELDENFINVYQTSLVDDAGQTITRYAMSFYETGSYTAVFRLYYKYNNLYHPVYAEKEQDFEVHEVSEFIEEQSLILYNKGYADGYANASEASEKWDFYTMISAVVSAPLTFLDQAFNFTVFGINIASFVRVLFTCLLIVFVVVVILRLVT